ncbi:MAG: hypothetical protein A2Y62_01015 [Candidatus Fischerbacteria bacterium RBG_13_37_8]|uniref:Peptidase C39-like domain-containing protein n=1 Tax=Candidatus Fischerbacteria bacterium RBG_13_37_8 TaxID=1817863 RepID=A0A1F5VT83_9BACT|nr:MAG: hypothetical protein A2Y62_01015 [Candidatus Fischerbacteria bacterium RBG_13_37_8]
MSAKVVSLKTIVIFIGIAVAVSYIYAQQSTTGPIPPAGLYQGKAYSSLAQVVISGIPIYLWHRGCGPTAVGMVIGYWDGKGFDQLVPGDATTQTSAVNAMIATDNGDNNCSSTYTCHRKYMLVSCSY